MSDPTQMTDIVESARLDYLAPKVTYRATVLGEAQLVSNGTDRGIVVGPSTLGMFAAFDDEIDEELRANPEGWRVRESGRLD